MALAYPDGWGLYCLNGVRVPPQIVTTPAEQLDCQFILKERNAEIRREFVRKAGIEKVCKDLGAKTLDVQDSYELLALNIGDGLERPYLKMKNPSIGVYHIEGVSPECRTVQQALNWRNSLTDAEIDEVKGADWYQQGDVVIRPSGVKTFKSQPIVLT